MKLSAAKKAQGAAHPLQHLDEALRGDRALPVANTPAERRRDHQQISVDDLRRLSAGKASGKAPAVPSPSPYTSGFSTSGGEPLHQGEAGPSASPDTSSATPSTSATPCTSASPFSSTTPYTSSTPEGQAGAPCTSPASSAARSVRGHVTFSGGNGAGGGGGGGGSGECVTRHVSITEPSIVTDFAAPPPVSTTPAAAGGEAPPGAAAGQSRLPRIARLAAFAVRKRQVQGEDQAAVQSEASGILGRMAMGSRPQSRSPQAQARPASGTYSRGRERDASAASAAGAAGAAGPLVVDERAQRSLAMGAGASWDSAIGRASEESTMPPPAALPGGPKSSLVTVTALLPPPPPPSSASTASAAAAKGIGLVRVQLAARGVHSSTHGNVVDDAAIAEELQGPSSHKRRVGTSAARSTG